MNVAVGLMDGLVLNGDQCIRVIPRQCNEEMEKDLRLQAQHRNFQTQLLAEQLAHEQVTNTLETMHQELEALKEAQNGHNPMDISLTGLEIDVHVSWIPHHMDLHPGNNVYLTSWFILSVLFLTGGRCLWFLHMSRIPHHTDLHPGRNIYPTSSFILSVLFLTGGGTSVVPTHVRDPLLHGPPSW